jgi:hypothetical protein
MWRLRESNKISGEAGIRTLEGRLTPTHFPGVLLRPARTPLRHSFPHRRQRAQQSRDATSFAAKHSGIPPDWPITAGLQSILNNNPKSRPNQTGRQPRPDALPEKWEMSYQALCSLAACQYIHPSNHGAGCNTRTITRQHLLDSPKVKPIAARTAGRPTKKAETKGLPQRGTTRAADRTGIDQSRILRRQRARIQVGGDQHNGQNNSRNTDGPAEAQMRKYYKTGKHGAEPEKNIKGNSEPQHDSPDLIDEVESPMLFAS